MRSRLRKQEFEYLIGITLLLIMGLFPSISSKVAYFHFVFVITLVFFSMGQEQLERSVYRQVLLYGLLSVIALAGCIKTFSFFSIRNVGALIFLAFFVAWYGNRDCGNLNIRFFLALFTFYLLLLAIAFQYYSPRENHTGNLYAGFICFISCTGTFLYLQIKRNKLDDIWQVAYIVLTLYLLFVTQGRTGLATYICIWLFYFGSKVIGSKKILKYSFWLIVILLITMIVIYIYLPQFSWYRSVNKYSVALFDKNLNSSRGTLWLNELSRLKESRWFFGLGTGTLPSMERYAKSSTHSSFIQILVQNGVIGLSVLLLILFSFWRRFACFLKDKPIRFALSVLFGVMLYNCFEVTLLQNKISVGITQWFILCMAISRAKLLEQNQRRKRIDREVFENGEQI